MGLGRLVILDPNVRKIYLELAEPSLEDQRSDVLRLKEALTEEGHDMVAGVPVLRTLPNVLREAGFHITAVLAGENPVAIEARATPGGCFRGAFRRGTQTPAGTAVDPPPRIAASVLFHRQWPAPYGAAAIPPSTPWI